MVDVHDQVVQAGKNQPAQQKRKAEGEQGVAPLGVHQSSERVGQIVGALARYPDDVDVNLAVLEDDPLPYGQRYHRPILSQVGRSLALDDVVVLALEHGPSPFEQRLPAPVFHHPTKTAEGFVKD